MISYDASFGITHYYYKATITLSSSNENTLVDDIVVDEAFNDSNPVAANYRTFS